MIKASKLNGKRRKFNMEKKKKNGVKIHLGGTG